LLEEKKRIISTTTNVITSISVTTNKENQSTLWIQHKGSDQIGMDQMQYARVRGLEDRFILRGMGVVLYGIIPAV
jgi:hypothetical protein